MTTGALDGAITNGIVLVQISGCNTTRPLFSKTQVLLPIAHLHNDVTCPKSSGSCSQIRGMFRITMALKDNNSVEKAKNLGSCRVILTEEDIPGASLQKRKPENLKNEELRRWFKCRGGSVGGNRVQLLER